MSNSVLTGFMTRVDQPSRIEIMNCLSMKLPFNVNYLRSCIPNGTLVPYPQTPGPLPK